MKLYERKLKSSSTWYIDYYDQAGTRHRHRLKGITTRRNAELAFAEFQLKYERGVLSLPTDEGITLKDVLKTRIEEREQAGCVSKWVECLKVYRNNLLAHFGDDFKFKALQDSAIAEYRKWRRGLKISVETVNKELAFLGGAGKLALKQGKIGKLPWIKLDRAMDRQAHEKWGYLKTDEIEALLDILKNGGKRTKTRSDKRKCTIMVPPSPRTWAMIVFLLNTGARKGEMFGLRWSDVNKGAKTVRLIGSKSAKNGKHAKPRYIPMNPALEDLFSQLAHGKASEHVFKRDGNLRRKLDKALEWAGLPHYRIHDLRHTFASHLVMNGVPLYTVAELLGHSSLSTSRLYSHLAPENLKSAVESLNFGVKGEDTKAA